MPRLRPQPGGGATCLEWIGVMDQLHSGAYHETIDGYEMTKRELAEHLARLHVGPDGRIRSVAFPPLYKRAEWRMDELEQSHRDLHGESR